MNRRGITAVELLVALSVIAVLIAIIVPAVMSARESSRRMQCRSNLAQFGRALHAYEAVHREFPPANPGDKQKGQSLHLYAAHVLLLPYLDQEPLYQKLDVSLPQLWVSDLENFRPAARTSVPVFLCPSDSGSQGTNYRVCMGPGVGGTWDDPAIPANLYGAFVTIGGRKAQDIKDGLSNTAAMSEKIKSDGTPAFSTGDFWYTGLNDVVGSFPVTPEDMLPVCGALTADPPDYYDYAGWSWLVSCYDFTWYNHALPPNAPIPDCSSQAWAPPLSSNIGVFTATSHHSGGVNCLFMDGAVKFISDAVDTQVWWAVASRTGGEPVSGFE